MYRELGASRIGHIRLGRHNLYFLSEYGNGMQLDGASFIFHNRMTSVVLRAFLVQSNLQSTRI